MSNEEIRTSSSMRPVDGPVHFLPANERGRDFVVGDVHGNLKELLALLDRVRFNPPNDRLLLTGDLVDRGPFSIATLRTVMEFRQSIFPVAGNHDIEAACDIRRVLEAGARSPHPEWAAHIAAERLWIVQEWNNHEQESWRTMADYLESLPRILVVGRGMTTRYHVTHAGLLDERGRVLCDADIDEPSPDLRHWIEREDFVWDRRLVYETRHGGASTLSPTYCGHTPGSTIQHIDDHLVIDTSGGCLKDPTSSLTMVQAAPGPRVAYAARGTHISEYQLDAAPVPY